MFVTFPENIDTLTAEHSEALEALISGRGVIAILIIIIIIIIIIFIEETVSQNFADLFWKKPDFSIVL